MSIARTSPPPNENYSARRDIKSQMCRPTPTRPGWPPGKPRGKGLKHTDGSHSLPITPRPLLSTLAFLSSVHTAAVTCAKRSSCVTSVPRALRQSMAVASMFLVLIFKTIPVCTRSIAGVLRPWTAAWERYFRPKPFHITVAELREMKSSVWLPGARCDCQAFVVGTKVVVQPVCSQTHIQAVPGRRPHIHCDGLLEWSLKWTSHRTSVKTLLKSSSAMRPSPRSHALNVVKGVRQCGQSRQRLLMAFACMRRRQWERCINLGLLTITYGRAFWDRIIVSYRDILCSIVSYPSFSPTAISCHH